MTKSRSIADQRVFAGESAIAAIPKVVRQWLLATRYRILRLDGTV
jgi:hypothetical protein